MKKYFILLYILHLGIYCSQQRPLLEKSITGVQFGLFGTNLYNETKLSEAFVLRSEIGLYPSYLDSFLVPSGYLIYPYLSVGSKYYYNLKERYKKGKNTANNSGNYAAVRLEYIPNWFIITNIENISIYPTFSIIPTWGFRRWISPSWDYEFKVGLGLTLNKWMEDKLSMTPFLDLGFKIGYLF